MKIIKISKGLIKKYLLGRPGCQVFFDKLHRLSLAGMSYGNGSKIEDSGELGVIKLLARYFKNKKPVVFDVGAQEGDYSEKILDAFKNNVNLYSFEPSTPSFVRIGERLKDYLNATSYNIGLGVTQGSAVLYGTPGGRMNSIFPECLELAHLSSSDIVKEEIKLTTLNVFCRENNIRQINLLKMDAEGNELNVLLGAGELLENDKIDFIQFEFGAANIYSRTYFKDFFRLLNPKYRIYRILSNGIAPMDTYKERYEIFTVTNFLAVLRRINLS